MKITTLFFDVYQTLLSVELGRSEKGWDVFSKFLNEQGILIDSRQFKKTFDQEKMKCYQSVNDPEMKFRHHDLFDLIYVIFRNLAVRADKKEILDLIWKFWRKNHPRVELYPGAKYALAELSQKYSLSIASYAQSSYTHKELEELGIAQFFSHFIYSSDIGYRKTDREFYKICLKRTGRKPAECLMVGDNYLQDVVIPKSIGLKALLVKNPLTDKQNITAGIEPDGIVKIEDMATLPLAIRPI